MVLIAGIDEAGRGPCIGPMVISGVSIDETKLSELSRLGVKDSKLLTAERREELAKEIRKLASDYKTILIEPEEIDRALMHPSMNLNKLEAVKTAEIIAFLNPAQVIIDCPQVNTKAYKFEIRNYLDSHINPAMLAENKADENYVIVGAASILAKVTRDEMIEKIKKELGVDFGSGYSSDPKTIIFLEENWENEQYGRIFRKSWDSFKKQQLAKSQTKLAEW
ncbi:ribonuclease HII [Candidatus Woesearchaeota archaeon]|nr:ribonuclease HII [Candidatus Woesearchaeota archaeon]